MSAEPSSSTRVIFFRLTLIAMLGLVVIASACCFILSETERAIVLRFGKPVRILDDSGLYLRFPPPIDRVVRLDRRLQHADIRISETLTRDQRNVIVPAFFTWRIDDALRFHTSLGEVAVAHEKLDAMVTSARNTVLGRHDFADIVAAGSGEKSLPAIEAEILTLAKEEAKAQLGIDLLSIGITRVQLPEANTESVFRRMRAERKREATRFRAEGRAQSAEMKAETDKQANHLIADSKRQAEEIRGKSEADAAAIYAAAHGRDPEFYRFLRELQSLRTIVDKNTTLVLDTSVAPLHWLKETDAKLPGLPPTKMVDPPALTESPSAPTFDPLRSE